MKGIEFQLNRSKSHTLVIKDYCIRYVETRGKDSLEVKKYCERALPPGIIENGKIMDIESLMIILDECATIWKIRRKEIFLLVPDSVLFFRRITIPNNVLKDEIQGYLYMEIGSTIHLPFEEPIFDYFYIGKDEQLQHLLLFAAPSDVIEDYVEVCEYAKLRPKLMDSSALAIYRLFNQYCGSKVANQLLFIQFDLKSISLSFFEGFIPTFIRHFILDTDMKKWNGVEVKGEEYLTFNYAGDFIELQGQFRDGITEIDKVINFYQYSMNQGRKQVERIVLTGDHPNLGEIEVLLRNRFTPTIERFEDFKSKVQVAENKVDAICLNIGLGLKEVK